MQKILSKRSAKLENIWSLNLKQFETETNSPSVYEQSTADGHDVINKDNNCVNHKSTEVYFSTENIQHLDGAAINKNPNHNSLTNLQTKEVPNCDNANIKVLRYNPMSLMKDEQNEQDDNKPLTLTQPHKNSIDFLTVNEKNKLKLSFSEFNTEFNFLQSINLQNSQTNNLELLKSSLYLKNSETILVFGGINPDDNVHTFKNEGKQVLRYVPSTNEWEIISYMVKSRQYHAIAYFQGRVYLAGGSFQNKNKMEITSSMWSFDSTTRTWHSETDMPYARRDFALIVCHLQLYAIGGEDKDKNALNKISCYDPFNVVWREATPMHIARCGPSVTRFKNTIIVAGGIFCLKNRTITNSVESFDPFTNQWTIIEQLRIPRSFAKLCAINDTLYIIGGIGYSSNQKFITLSCIDHYDNNTKTWTYLCDMENSRYGHDIAIINSQIIIIGGKSFNKENKNMNKIECYCTKRCVWIEGIANLNYSLHKLACAVLPPANII